MKISELTGAQLDQWVARAEGKCYTTNPREWGNALINHLGRLSIAKTSWDCAKYFEPSSNWGHGGPIIDRERICVAFRGGKQWVAGYPDWPWEAGYAGTTALVAAMRAYVASKYGREVQE
ncbi:TPA: DUF2591 family protein [Burkholderia vietnamiensis]|nr:DUF2591 family protein [Burkholderia vietnamiensis]